ncbi:MAG TPA: CDP-glycerol glycerophosphotransferase family protein [Abditibacteriaceae bacterium]
MKVAYYAANMQGLTWVKPVHDLTGGALCTDRETTFNDARQMWPQARVLMFEAGSKWSLRRTRGESKTTLSQREDHVQLAEIARREQPDVIVTTANFPHYIRRSGLGAWRQGGALPHVKQVQMFHGISSKHNKFKPFMANYDLLLFVGERDKQRFERLGVLGKTRWRLIGLPRSDRIARGEVTRDAMLQTLGLPLRPTVLYAPTHGALSSFFEWGRDICEAVPGECNLIIKPHPLIARAVESGTGDSAMWNALHEYSLQREGTLFLGEANVELQHVMAAADVLVTDFSSAAEEFLIFNRPLVFANHLASSGYHLTRGEWDEIQSCGQVVTDKQKLPHAISDTLQNPQQHEAQRMHMRDHVYHHVDGRAAERASQALVDLVGQR